MQQYKIKPDGFKEIKKKALIRTVPIMLIAGAAGISISMINSKPEESNIQTLPFVIPLVLIALFVGLNSGMKRQRKLFESYTLSITNNLITRTQLDTPVISLYISEISQIWKAKNGNINIKGKNPADVIIVPEQIENYQQLEMLLQQIKPFSTTNPLSFYERYQRMLSLVSIVLMVCVYTVMNKIVVAICGAALITLIIWSLINITNSKNADSKTKRTSMVSLLVLVSVLFVMFFKLFIL